MGQSSSHHIQKKTSSTLEYALREGRWDDVRSHLQTPEGRTEVQKGLKTDNHNIIVPALFASLIHRAPFDIIQSIQEINAATATAAADDDDNVGVGGQEIHAALDGATRGDTNNNNNDQRRVYSKNEYETVVEYVIQNTNTTNSCFVEPSSFGGAKLTPLAHGIWNRNVSCRMILLLCFRCPDAMMVEVSLDDDGGSGISRFLPIDLAVGESNREKRDVLMLGPEWYRNVNDEKQEDVMEYVNRKKSVPKPGVDDYIRVLSQANGRKNWTLIRDLLPDAVGAGVSEDDLVKFRSGLRDHDEKMKDKQKRDEYHKKRFGLALVEWYVLKDMVEPFVPWKKRKNERKVPVMR